ncbi:MAG: OmpA family protein [Acidobacteriota bacterium]|nr:OmpA family protein [Acidobacteriota bacterium]
MSSAKTQPIVIVKKKGGHGGHHGGAWKVAYADFVTAMMSLFIVLWLMNSSDKIKKAVAGYFNDPKGTANLLGTTMNGNGITVEQERSDALQKLKKKLEAEIRARKELEKLSKQIEITITPEGLRIELLETKNGTFYESGSARLSASGQELLALLASELKTLPNDLLIEGHTDAAPYSQDTGYSNWELSADRANAARRLLQAGGVRQDQVTQVRGYADQMLRVKSNPYDPSNRRISILVKNASSPLPNLTGAQTVDGPPAQPRPPAVPAGNPPQVAQSGQPPADLPAKAPKPAPPASPSTQASGLLARLTKLEPVPKK